VAAALATLTVMGHPASPAHARAGHLTVADLPLASQAVVSRALGSQDPLDRVHGAAGTFSARNADQGLSTRFDRAGVRVSSAGTRLGLRLRSIAWGSVSSIVGAVEPRAAANTVTYSHSGVSEQYANGPLGLEQSFLVDRPSSRNDTGALTLSVALASNRSIWLAHGGRGLVFGRSGAGLRYSGLFTTDAAGRRLPSWLTLARGRLLIHVNARGARFPLRIDPFFQQGPKLTAGEETGAGEAGAAVALSADGNTALVGGPGDASDVGAAWVFTRSGSTWAQQGPKLTGSGETGAGRFGFGVSLSGDGNTALIGAPLDNAGAGAVWNFTRSGSTWSQQGGKLTGGVEESGKGEFGIDVRISADASTALVGASADSGAAGAAWVFTNTGTGWEQQGSKLTGAGESGAGRFGFSVALSEEGSTALIGGGSDSAGTGAAWAFTRAGTTWEQQGAKLTGTGEVGAGHFGFSVALSGTGDTAMVGGVADNSEVGAAWPFVRSAGVWEQQGSKLTGSGESGRGLFGAQVALSAEGNAALVSGSGDAGNVGAVWPFTRTEGVWALQEPKLTGAEESGPGAFGVGLAVSADAQTALVGGSADNAGVGAAWVLVDLPLVPAVVTKPATGILGTSATLNGTVNPNGKTVTDCHFNYGITTAYGSTVPCATSPGSGNSPVAVSAPVTGLQLNTTYHFQLVATNANGTGEGADEQFSTADPPEFGRCVKLAKGVKGTFATATCTTPATAEKFSFEWQQGPGANRHFTAVIKPTTLAILETVTKRKIECTGATAAGEYTGRRTVGGVSVTLTGCSLLGTKCSSTGAAEGELVSSALEGQIGIEKTSSEAVKNKVALDLFPVGVTGPVTEFTCGSTTAVIDGSVLAQLVSNKMFVKDTLKYVETSGKQKPEQFEGVPKDVLSMSLAEAPFEQTGLKLTLNRTNDEAIEISTVV
jgi:hypothetical protein